MLQHHLYPPIGRTHIVISIFEFFTVKHGYNTKFESIQFSTYVALAQLFTRSFRNIGDQRNMVRAGEDVLRRPNNRRIRRFRQISNSLRNQVHVVNRVMQNSRNVENILQDGSEVQQHSAEMRLRLWAVKNNISRIAMGELLKILISIGLTYLPCDPRTILKTPQNIQLLNQANGQVWYCGIGNNLRRIFSTLKEEISVSLNFNIDGIPLYNSAKHEFWPILANIHSKKIYNFKISI